jgi:hypothetical protein
MRRRRFDRPFNPGPRGQGKILSTERQQPANRRFTGKIKAGAALPKNPDFWRFCP